MKRTPHSNSVIVIMVPIIIFGCSGITTFAVAGSGHGFVRGKTGGKVGDVGILRTPTPLNCIRKVNLNYLFFRWKNRFDVEGKCSYDG
jgi:hypothetical protein